MRYQIKNRWTDAVIYASDVADSVRDALLEALKSGADLSGADLRGADLRGSDLSGANLRGANLRPIRDDLWAVLSSVPAEVPALRAAIMDGRVDGSTYNGTCACLVGTIANARGCDYNEIPGLSPNSSRPIERFFLAISPGNTPENHEPSRLALTWVDEWLTNIRAAIPALAPAAAKE